ncbi:MAG: DUF4410 domain-containing protein [Lysobacterales bacterium]
MIARSSRYRLLAAATLAALMVTGCATTKSTRAEPLQSTGIITDVKGCTVLTVMPFSVPADSAATAETGKAFSNDIAGRLRGDFGPLFDSVETADAARGVDGECLFEGAITKYMPGNRAVRLATLPGVGSVHFEGNIKVIDSASGRELLAAPFDKLWAFSGVIGASKGIANLEKETAAAAAATVARAKGWEPPPAQ